MNNNKHLLKLDATSDKDYFSPISNKALQIMKDKPLGWEFLLFAELLNDYMKECEDVKRDLVYENPLGESIALEDPIQIVNWVQERLRLLKSITYFMTRLINEAYRKAIGEPGQSGDAKHIYYVAKKFIEGYKSIIEWRLKFFTLNVDPTYIKFLNLTSNLASNAIKETEAFVIRFHKEANEIFNSSYKDEEKKVIRFSIDLGIPDSPEFHKESERLINMFDEESPNASDAEDLLDTHKIQYMRSGSRLSQTAYVKSVKMECVMDENCLFEMSELYRKTRKAVYEEATRPLSNNPDRHRKNKEKFKESVEKLCFEAVLSKYCGTDRNTAIDIWHHMWTKNRYAGIRSQIATTEIRDIEKIFDEYDRFSGEDWNIEAAGQNLIKGGLQIHDFLNRKGDFLNKQTIGNIPKLVKIVSVARLLTKFMQSKGLNTPVLSFITNGYSDDDVWAVHGHLMKIGYRSDLTVLHFMMDLGFQVIKPDIVISKIFLDWGWLHMKIPGLPKDLRFEDLQGKGKYGQRFKYTCERMYKPAIDLAREIVSKTKKADLEKDIGWVTNNPIREFDIFLVKYGQQPEKEFGIERTLYKATLIA